MDVISAISMQNAASHEEHIAVLLNSSAEQSADKIKEEILDRYDKNTFHSILFNQNLSATDKLYVKISNTITPEYQYFHLNIRKHKKGREANDKCRAERSSQTCYI